MNNELVSVIVPVYKVEEYLDRCVNSLVNQTYKNIEIVLVDDGSPDNCPKMCDEWAKKDERIKVLHKQNGGLMAAWMDGVKMATGNYIAFVDSDDWCELNMIEELYNPFTQHEIDMTISHFYVSTATKKLESPSNKMKLNGLVMAKDVEKQILRKPNAAIPLYRWNKMYKKDLLLNNFQFCDPRITVSEDSCIVQACLLDVNSIYFVDKCLYHYFFRTTSMIRTYNKNLNEKLEIYFKQFLLIHQQKGKVDECGLLFERARLTNLVLNNIVNSKLKNKNELIKDVLELDFVKDIDLSKDDNNLSFRAKVLIKAVKKKRIKTIRLLFLFNGMFIKFKEFIKKIRGKYKKI